jgi:hypothetical protein
MKAQLYIATLPLIAVVAFAQNAAPQAPAQAQQAPAQAAQDSKATHAPAVTTQNNAPEMRTRNYSGVLADASCLIPGSATNPAAGSVKTAPDTTGASGAAEAAKTKAGDANHAPTADQGQSCPVSANTTQFAIKLKEGQIVKLDDVGNQRAQEALKNNKKWSEAVASGKSIHVDANGVLNGDQLIAMSIK